MSIKQFLLALFIVLSLTSCKKEDYRDKYMGRYILTTTRSSYNYLDSTKTDSTYVDSVKIVHGKNSNEISIEYTTGSLPAELKADGSFNKLRTSGQGWGFSGKFLSTEEVEFSLAYFGSPAITKTSTGLKIH